MEKCVVKKIFRTIVATMFAVGLTGGITLSDTFIPHFAMTRAEAGIFDGLFGGSSDQAVEDLKNSASESIHDQINKALEINVDGLNDRKNDMRLHMSRAAEYLMIAAFQTEEGTVDNPYGVYANLAIALGNNPGDMEYVYQSAATPLRTKEVEEGCKNLMQTQDKQKVEEGKQHLEYASNARITSMVYQGLAARDASLILGESLKGLKNIKKINNVQDAEDEIGNVKGQLEELSALAKDVELLCKDISEKNKNLGDATKKARKHFNIKEPSKKDIEKQVKTMEAR